MPGKRKRTLAIFGGASEMHARIRAYDWAATPLGSVETWPQSLTSLVKTLLASQYPMVLTWGPHFIQFYNDAYSRLIGDKHPGALGQDIRITMEEGWSTLGPMIGTVMTTGVANWTPALLLVLDRAGYREEAYFSVSHAPAEDDSGAIVGMLAVCSEVTQQVLGERRLRLLRDLALRTSESRSIATTCASIAACIAEYPLDVPFALLYLRDDQTLVLHGAVGLSADTPLSPPAIDLPTGPDAGWPFDRAIAGEIVQIEDLSAHHALQGGPWHEPVRTAVAMPIGATSQTNPDGILIAGVSPNTPFDESYHSFYALLAGQLSAAIRNARIFEEERERVEALARLDRAKTEFFSNVSHEFRTPLTLMLGPLVETLAETHGPLHPEDRESLQLVHRNSLRLLKLVNSLLDFARTEADRLQASYEPIDLASLTTDLASVFRAAIEKAGLELAVICPPLGEPAYVDPVMWEKIVLNLLSNAFKFTREGRITVQQEIVDGHICLAVADTGCGIPATELTNVFTRFHRIEGTPGRTHEGTGIGLALVQELVRLHGGTVQVESTFGEGSTFTVMLPRGYAHLPAERVSSGHTHVITQTTAFVDEALRWVADDLPQAAPATISSPPPEIDVDLEAEFAADEPPTGGRARILLADDNADMRQYVGRILSTRYEVVAVPDGEAALLAVREHRPDMVLSDIMMPKLDGVGLLARLRADPRTSTIPVILLSAQVGEEVRAAGLESGADDYLTKPFAARELLARVTTHLELARMRHEAGEERARRAAAEALVREREQFLSLASHELRTPLTSIRGYTDLLLRRTKRENSLAPRDQQALAVISQQVERLYTLMNVLLDLSRLQMNQLPLECHAVDLPALVRRIAATTALVTNHHTLQLDLPDDALLVWGDEFRLEQVLQTLLGNAVKYSPLGGMITVALAHQGDRISLAIRDQGIGIPEAGRNQIFQRFYRASNVNPQQISGLGIGLYLAQEIVALHHGSIDVTSEEGQGSTFTVWLPTTNTPS